MICVNAETIKNDELEDFFGSTQKTFLIGVHGVWYIEITNYPITIERVYYPGRGILDTPMVESEFNNIDDMVFCCYQHGIEQVKFDISKEFMLALYDKAQKFLNRTKFDGDRVSLLL